MKRDGASVSIWQSAELAASNIQPGHSKDYDVIIIGAGITGLTTALRLQQAGKNCMIAESVSPGFGTTGGTTAHLNTFYDTPYGQMISDFGEANAKLIAEGAALAISLIKKNITDHHIDCAFDERDGYLFSLNEKQDKELEEIVTGAAKVSVNMAFTNNNPFPIPHLKVARIPGQAQFNPIQYLFGLVKIFEAAGGKVFENCRVQEIKEEQAGLQVITSAGVFSAKQAVYATHIPPGVNLLHFRCAPYRSYVLGVKLKDDEYPLAMGYDMDDPYHYYRTQEIDGQQYLVAGGEDHKTGHEENTEACFQRLEAHVRTYFRVEEISFRWSSQYFEPNDGLPYIGHLPGNGKNVYVATGFGGNGIIYGTLAGIILSDILTTGESGYRQLLDPNRIKPIAGFSNFVKEGADVVKHLVSGFFSADKIKELSALAKEEARVVKYEGSVAGIYRDETGALHAVNAACPHIRCSVAWNAAEKSWDCPCHGSRFDYDGKLLTAPAVADLEKIDLSKTGA